MVMITGVGTSNFGKQSLTAEQLASAAIAEAMTAARVTAREIEAIYLGPVFSYAGTAHRALRAAGLAHIPVITVENACASGTLAVHLASQAVRVGEYETVLAVGLEKMSDWIKGPIPTDPGDAEALGGMQLPSLYAMSANRYREVYGVTPEQLAQISVKNHANALENPRAQYRGDYTVAQILESRPISDPLTLLQCSPISDGAGAAVIRSDRAASPDRPRVELIASRLESGDVWPNPYSADHVWNFELIERTTARVLADSGLGTTDIDVCEVHDAFTIGEIVTIEAMGFCGEGEGARFAAAGETERTGSIPVNPSGGLLSRGHPLGATGLAQTAEIFWQLTGQAAGRQVPGARVGLVETMGGSASGLSGNGCVVMALRAV